MKTDKELYQLFSVDVCTQSYAMEYVLIGAVDEDDLLQHMPEILKTMGKSKEEIKTLKKYYKYNGDGKLIEKLEGTYTERPYTPLTYYWYCE